MSSFFAKLRPITFSVYLKPEQGQTRCVASRLPQWKAWAKIDELTRMGSGKAWMLPG